MDIAVARIAKGGNQRITHGGGGGPRDLKYSRRSPRGDPHLRAEVVVPTTRSTWTFIAGGRGGSVRTRFRERCAPGNSPGPSASMTSPAGPAAQSLPSDQARKSDVDASSENRQTTLAYIRRQASRSWARPVACRNVLRCPIWVAWSSGSGRTTYRADRYAEVLAMVCFLLTRPRWAATREEVSEALWPDQSPRLPLTPSTRLFYSSDACSSQAIRKDTSAGICIRTRTCYARRSTHRGTKVADV
jgi:hypothetical protein